MTDFPLADLCSKDTVTPLVLCAVYVTVFYVVIAWHCEILTVLGGGTSVSIPLTGVLLRSLLQFLSCSYFFSYLKLFHILICCSQLHSKDLQLIIINI